MPSALCNSARKELEDIRVLYQQFMEAYGKAAEGVRGEEEVEARELKAQLEQAMGKLQAKIVYDLLAPKEQIKLNDFFEMAIEIPLLPKEVTMERIEFWKKNHFELHYLPSMEMAREDDDGNLVWKKLTIWKEPLDKLPGEDGIIHQLTGGWRLMDMRPNPAYTNGSQMYQNDELIGSVLANLRAQGIIKTAEDVPDPSSRFGISAEEIENPQVQAVLASALDVPTVSTPSALENNILMHLHLSSWGDTRSSEWFSDSIARHRLGGGLVAYGGLSGVYWGGVGNRDASIGFCPLGSFDVIE